MDLDAQTVKVNELVKENKEKTEMVTKLTIQCEGHEIEIENLKHVEGENNQIRNELLAQKAVNVSLVQDNRFLSDQQTRLLTSPLALEDIPDGSAGSATMSRNLGAEIHRQMEEAEEGEEERIVETVTTRTIVRLC